MDHYKGTIFSVIATIVTLICVFHSEEALCKENSVQALALAPTFTAQSVNGGMIDTEKALKDKPLYLFFFNPYDPTGIAKVISAYQKHSDKVTFVGLAPAMNLNEQWLKTEAANYGINFPVILDQGNQLFRSFDAWQHPKYILIDKKGVMQYQGKNLQASVTQLLALTK